MPRPGTRPGASFSEQDVALLEFIFTGLLRGADISAAVRHPSFKRIAKTAQALRARAELLKREKQR